MRTLPRSRPGERPRASHRASRFEAEPSVLTLRQGGRHLRHRPVIVDEFSNLPISRQRKYQLRKQRDKRCTLCGLPAVRGSRCLEHLVKDREMRRKRYGYTKRYRNAMGYRLEAESAQ